MSRFEPTSRRRLVLLSSDLAVAKDGTLPCKEDSYSLLCLYRSTEVSQLCADLQQISHLGLWNPNSRHILLELRPASLSANRLSDPSINELGRDGNINIGLADL
jgi:hypothetical protein